MMTNEISFPGLSIGPFTVKESFSLFGLIDIHWYGVIIACGLILAYLFAKKKAEKRGISDETLLDVVIWGLPSALLCARIYYVILSYEKEFRGKPWVDMLKIWEGGIAIYGAVIGACLAAFIYCYLKKIDFRKVFDVGAFGLLIGQCVGRWGNFVNAEAFGTNTSLPWGMSGEAIRIELTRYAAKGVPVNPDLPVHPTFFYESLWNFVLFLLLNLFEKYQKFDGEIFLWYVTFYGVGRFFIEGLRIDSLMAGDTRFSQAVALVCVMVGVVLIIFGRIRAKKQKNL